MNSHTVVLSLTAKTGSKSLQVINPFIKGLIGEVVPIELGLTKDKNALSEKSIIFKNRTDAQTVSVEFDLLENKDTFGQLVSWFEQIVIGPPSPDKLRREGQVTVEGDDGNLVSSAKLFGMIPIRWETSSFDNATAPRVTFYFAYDGVDFNKSEKASKTSRKHQGSGSVDGTAAGSAQYTQKLTRKSKDAKAQNSEILVDSCSGFAQSIETERVWDTEKSGSVQTAKPGLVHTIKPGRSLARVKFFIKMNGDSESKIQSLIKWQSQIMDSGKVEKWDLNYSFRLGSESDHQIDMVLKDCRPVSIELCDLNPTIEPTMVVDIICERIDAIVGGAPARAPEPSKENQSPPSVAFDVVSTKWNDGTRNETCQALVLFPRYIVPGISQSFSRSELRFSGNKNLVLPEDLKSALFDKKSIQPADVIETSFFIYAENPWSGNQMGNYDLRVHLENVLFPIFYSYPSVPSRSELAAMEFRTPDEHLRLNPTMDFRIEASGSINWRSLDNNLQLPGKLFAKPAEGGNEYWQTVADKPAVGIPIVVALSPKSHRNKGEDLAPEPITGFLTSCRFSIDQWNSIGKPYRAKLTLGLQRYRGLHCTKKQIKSPQSRGAP